MSNIDADLVLHLTLDEIREGKFLDASGHGRDGLIKGNVTIVPDDTFGSCASFPGAADSFITVPDSSDLQIGGDLTLQAWVYLTGPPTDWVRIAGKGAFSARNYGLWYNAKSWLFQRMSGANYQNCDIPSAQQTPQLNNWYHLAAVIQGNIASVYLHDLQGQFLLPQPVKAVWAGAPATSGDPLTIGYAGYHGGHKGKIVNVRVYRRALSQAEIEQDIRADCMRLVAFRKSHPIDFRVYDDDEQAVLYISDDSDGRNLNLELRNTSAQAIQLSNGQNAVASDTNHHFALRFRPGTLSNSTLRLLINPQGRATILKQADLWDLYFPSKQPAANESASLYLLYKGPSKSFQPDERRALTLQRMSAAPGSGARGTQVELVPRQLTAAGGDATPITGSRTQYVHVTNQRGKKNIPLHIGFVEGNTVLNDGKTPNKLRLRITNASKKDAITLNSMSDREPSKFIVSFDAQSKEQKEWALVESDNAKDVKVRVKMRVDKNEIGPAPNASSSAASVLAGLNLRPNEIYLGISSEGQEAQVSWDEREINPEGIQGETPEWPITFDRAVRLAPGQHIEVEIAEIVTSLQTGHANLYVRYENIPGYWDGQFICAVEKGPIVCDHGNVGIGTVAPAAKLEVVGGVIAQSLTVSGTTQIGGNLSLSPNSTVSFPPGCKIAGLPIIAIKKAGVSGVDVAGGVLVQKKTVEFASKVLSAETIVSYVHSEFSGGVDSSKVWSEGQLVEILNIVGNTVSLNVVVWRKYQNAAQTPKQNLAVEVVVIATLEGA